MRLPFALLLATATGCTPGLPEPVGDPGTRAELEKRAEEVTRLQRELEEADPKLREACEFKAGDCMLELRDKRRELVRGRTFLECEALGYAEKTARCEEDKLIERGEGEAVEAYYDYQVWCLSGMTECLSDQVEQAKLAAHAAMVAERRAAFFGSELGAGLETDLRVAEEQLAYARTTLPPVADTACQDLPTVATCRQRAVDALTKLEEYLSLPEAKYTADRAEELLKQSKSAEIECVNVERECVEGELEKHGATKASRALMKENYDLVEQRQRLREKIDPGAAEACIREGQAEHAPYIMENYRQYARQRIEYFRVQMHRAFARVHRAQIQCLKRAGAK